MMLTIFAGARRLITYCRVPEAQVDQKALRNREKREEATGVTADDLNAFRRKVCMGMTSLTCFVTANAWAQYFQGFKDQQQQVEANATPSS